MPTRISVEGIPDLGTGSLLERRKILSEKFDQLRTAAIKEPRDARYLIGWLLCEPVDRTCVSDVIFFEGASCLGMCGHGTIGLIAILKHIRRIDAGVNKIEAPIRIITTHCGTDGSVCPFLTIT